MVFLGFKVLVYKEDRTQNYHQGGSYYKHAASLQWFLFMLRRVRNRLRYFS